MKQELKRLKGQTISTCVGQLQLKQLTRLETCEYDHVYFTCNQQFLLCKIYNITNQNSIHRYEHEKQIYQSESYPSLARCISRSQVNVRKINYGVIVLDQIGKNSALNQTGNSLSFFQLLKLTKTVLGLIKELKTRNQVFLNLRPQNVYLNSEKKFIIINPQYICQKGNHSYVEENNQLFFNSVQKYFKYNSPEVLDNYTYFPIDQKSDIFSLGCILYEIIYGKYPFESKFANINIIYQIQEGFFGKLIERIFKPYKQRADVQQLMLLVDQQLKKNPEESKQMNTSSTCQSKSSKNVHSIFDDISSVFNKYTKQTQGAYLNFTQDNESFPQFKHLSFMLNKLYKNPNKVEKLQSIMTKHIQLTQFGMKKNFVIKNIALIFLVLRKNRNYMINKWMDNVRQIKEVLGQNSECIEFCQLVSKKIKLQQELNCVLRGNFYLEDVCQFKLLTLQNLVSMAKYLQNVLVYASKLIGYKEDDYLFHYVLEILCDQVYDLISMIIFCVICIRKDNQLGLRKDNLGALDSFQKSTLIVLLKKISNLSNKFSSHAIYSIEADFYAYKEDIYLKQTPSHTSFEYFVKHCNYYKGLTLPESNNFSSINEATNEFSSFEANLGQRSNNHQKKQSKKFFGNDINSDEDQSGIQIQQVIEKKTSMPNVSSGASNKSGSSKPITQNKNISINNLFGNQFNPQEQLKKVKSSQKPLSNFNIPVNNSSRVIQNKSGQKPTFDDFSNFFAEPGKKPSQNQIPKNSSNTPKSVQDNKPKGNQNKPVDIFQNFSFFKQEQTKKLSPKKQANKEKKPQQLIWPDFNEAQKKSQSVQGQNPGSNQVQNQKAAIKIDPNILKQDIFNFQWLKKCENNPFGILSFAEIKDKKPQQQRQSQKLSPFVTEIINSLKLKELKDLIVVNKDVVIEFDKLIFQKVIGSGSAGQVYLGKYQNQSVAIKKVKIKQNPNALKEFERQLVTYIKIKKNPYLVSLIGLSKSGQDFYLLTQFCSGGSLFDLLHKKAGQIFLSWKVKMSLILQVAKGMKALHDMKPPIIHRDLKSLNVFVAFQNNEWVAKVADFGLSRSPEAQMMTMALGTLHWMAPQLLDNKQYSLKVDVYSFAVVMWEICARKTPYYELSNPMAIMKYVTIDKKRPNMSIIDINCPQKLLELIQKCWDQEPNKRPHFKEIIDLLVQIDSQIPSQ